MPPPMIQNKKENNLKKIYNVKKNPNISMQILYCLGVSVFKCDCATQFSEQRK